MPMSYHATHLVVGPLLFAFHHPTQHYLSWSSSCFLSLRFLLYNCSQQRIPSKYVSNPFNCVPFLLCLAWLFLLQSLSVPLEGMLHWGFGDTLISSATISLRHHRHLTKRLQCRSSKSAPVPSTIHHSMAHLFD